MPTGLTRVLVIHARLDKALGVQRLLKPLGVYDVRPFTSAENALSYMQDDGTPDLAIVDVEVRGMRVVEVMTALRQRRPDLPVILVGASDPDAVRAGAQAGVSADMRGRDLLPVIRRLTMAQVGDAPSAPVKVPPVPRDKDITQPDRTLLPTHPSPPEAFRRLAEEEPPAPTAAQGGTVRDLFPVDAPPAPVVEVAAPDESTPVVTAPSADDTPSSLAQQILQGAQQAAPFDEDDADLDSDKQPTPAPPPASVNPPRQLGRRKPPKADREPPTPAVLTQTKTLVALTPEQDAARRALFLTQAATESTAAAFILTRDSAIVATAGEMPAAEVEELRALLNDDWEPTGSGSRIRFVTLPSTGQDYMLIARRTGDGYTLTMAFLGDVPLGDIRRQSESLVKALANVPDPEPEPAPGQPMTLVWMLSAPDQPLTAEAAQAIVTSMDAHLKGDGWRIHNLNVHAEYIYIYCDVPVGSQPGEVAAQFRALTEQAVTSRMPERPTPVWADGYLALVPGREMGADEVRRFLRFSRMSPKKETSHEP